MDSVAKIIEQFVFAQDFDAGSVKGKYFKGFVGDDIVVVHGEPPTNDVHGRKLTIGVELQSRKVAGDFGNRFFEPHSNEFHAIVRFDQDSSSVRSLIDSKDNDVLLAQR